MTAILKTTVIQEPSSATNNLTLSTSGGVTVGQNLTVTGTTTLTGTVLTAGTATVAPLDFTAGTNLTTALPGAVEYDGKVFYGTPQSTQRGVIPGAQFFRLNSDFVGASSTSAQSIFNVGVTLSANTVYAFQTYSIFSKTATATSHNFQLGFGGTATLNNVLYGGWTNSAAASFTSGAISGTISFDANTATATTLQSLSAVAALSVRLYLQGTVSINAGGTFIPQYTTSAAVGPYSTLAGSYFMIYPIGASGANTSVGTWA